jgi:hypothetical protein
MHWNEGGGIPDLIVSKNNARVYRKESYSKPSVQPPAMKKQVLASSIAAVFVAAFMVPSLSVDSFAQVSSESRVLQAILGLTEVIKGQTDDLSDTLTNVEEDLLFKKKFWQIFVVEDIQGPAGAPGFLGVEVFGCTFEEGDPSACAFNVESIQVVNFNPSEPVNITSIWVDGVKTDLSGKELQSPSNVLVDSSIGKLGANSIVAVGGVLTSSGLTEGSIEFNGEKPQGMALCLFSQLGDDLVETQQL